MVGHLFIQILGSEGRVLRIDDSKDAIVLIKGETYVLNPDCLVFVRHDDSPLTEQNQPKTSQNGIYNRHWISQTT